MNRMNIVSLLAVALLASQVLGAVPNLINYQGVLTDDTGVVVADGTYKLTVRLYNVATGGSALFTESHDAVAVVDGVFSLSIGSVNTALGTLAFNDPYYLSLEVNDSGVELAPRVAIQAVPYALNTSSIAGTDVSGAAPNMDEVLQFNGTQWVPAVVSGGGSDTDWVESGGNVYRATGNVGIGTATPTEKLDVSGNVRATGNLTANGDVQGDQLVLTQPAGSAPMTISSNTLVSNLNADLLDGQQAADFLAAGANLADLGDVSGAAPAANDVLQYDGSEWTPATVSAGGGDITSVVAGAGLTGGATSGDATLDVATGTGLQVSGDQVQLATAYANGSAHDARFVNEGQGNSISSAMIVDGSVSSSDIGTDAVGAAEIQTGAVYSSEIYDDTITSLDIGANAVGNSELQDVIAVSSLTSNYIGVSAAVGNYAFDVSGDRGPGYISRIVNSDSLGTGLAVSGQDQGTVWYTTGAGIQATGRSIGGAFFCDDGAGSFFGVRVAERSGIENYKIRGTGTVASVMKTSRGEVTLMAPEAPEAWVQDYGSGEIRSGQGHVDLDPTFLECVSVSDADPLKVYIQFTSPPPASYYIKKGQTGFDVIESSGDAISATFDYFVVARWKGWEGIRFPDVEPWETVTQTVEEE